MKTTNRIKSILLSCALIQLLFPLILSAEQHNEHDEHQQHTQHEESDEHEQGVVTLSTQQMDAAGIKVSSLALSEVNTIVNAPGRVVFNRYKTVSITPRITSQLVKRYVALGDSVKRGQAIASLSSVDMAEAQGNLLLMHREWSRVQKLGTNIITEKRYTQSRVDWQLAKARAIAYGMTENQVTSFVKNKQFSKANGLFTLVSPINGTVLEEDYIKGQQVEAGDEINLITDESSLWVLANVSPKLARNIRVGNKATVHVDEQIYPAKVIQISHSVNEVTRTNLVRLGVDNKLDELHSGLFVDTQIQLENKSKTMVLTVSDSALLRSEDGDWQVMVEQDHPTEFKAVEVLVKRVINGIAVIEGLEPGTSIVTQGAFFVQSELAKGNFEVHNH
ncbi:MAG: efflux transporter periplasmic adaptor subunit [Gammaproteobacteria bacterium]|nr:MAG: efflux transporter periplasmic adaptor subunit [Gammaproteobacteria bacterium]